ncbi:MAG TPA: hypothetical protein VMU84_03110 [Thermoanaerobaculia bacterium]|nr:hypothetical protein [Thermoanaerobaculia bacterium]
MAASLLLTTSLLAESPKRIVLFMCPHGGAKSLIAASYFNELAECESLPYVASAVAAETPYDAVPDAVAEHLGREGFAVASFKPRHVEAADFASAERVITIDCDLTTLALEDIAIERWDDVPKVSEDLAGSAAAIRRHVERLIQLLE